MKSYQPFVTVVIPAFNEEKILAQTLRAILQQTYTNYEVIVVNNNSSDATGDIARSFVDDRLLVVDEPLPGVMSARECGRRHARGEIIALLDADCSVPLNWISQGVNYFRDDHTVAVAGLYDYHDAPLWMRVITDVTEYVFLPGINWLTQHLGRGASMMGGNAFVRASCLESLDGFDVRYQFYGDDSWLATQLARLGFIVTSRRITVATSARRYIAQGFFATQSRYFSWIWAHIWNHKKDISESRETVHPR